MVNFDIDCEDGDESAFNSHGCRGELMEIITKSSTKTQHLHSITFITILDSDQSKLPGRL
jgi:hypothetical protein